MVTTPTHDELRRLTARMLDDEAIGEHDRSRLLAYVAQAESTERERDRLLSVIIEQNTLIGRLQDEREHYREIALGGGSLNEANAKIAAVVKEHASVINGALLFKMQLMRGTPDEPEGTKASATAKALAEALK